MTSFQSSLESVRQRGGGSSWLPLLVGLALGLLLGLFIGWVAWPVEWQGAVLADLAPETRAEYVSAVADSYVYSLATTPNAAESARARLAGLGSNATQEVVTAIRYFQTRPDNAGSMRYVNLIQLANGLGMVVDQTAPPAPAVENSGGATVADTSNASSNAQDSVVTTTIGGEDSSSLLSWLLTLLGALALLAGGFYLLRQFLQPDGGYGGSFGWGGGRQTQRADQEEDADPFDDEYDQPVVAAGAGRSSWVRPLSPQATAAVQHPMQQPVARRSSWELEQEQDEEDEPEFEAEDVEKGDELPWDPPPATRTIVRTTPSASPPLPTPEPRRVYAPPPITDNPFETENPFEDDTDDEAGFDDSEEDDESANDASSARSAVAPIAQHRRVDDTVSNLYEPRSQPTKVGDAPTARFPGAKQVGSFECTYHSGVDEYDESYPVTDPASQRYIGECGMGVSTKNRILHKNPDEVVALEVWLFDKSDERNISDQMRVLMSEYASDHYADAFIKDRNGDNRPFVAQPGTRFQLEGRNLVLNGEVLDAEYNRNGVFQSVKVKLDVLKR